MDMEQDPQAPATAHTVSRGFLWLAGETGEYLTVLRESLPADGPGFPTGTEARVCGDIARRQQAGLAKYGTSVADNPLGLRRWLVHLYEEQLDAAVYTRRAIEKLDAMVAAAAAADPAPITPHPDEHA